jgi:hypothetical protein
MSNLRRSSRNKPAAVAADLALAVSVQSALNEEEELAAAAAVASEASSASEGEGGEVEDAAQVELGRGGVEREAKQESKQPLREGKHDEGADGALGQNFDLDREASHQDENAEFGGSRGPRGIGSLLRQAMGVENEARRRPEASGPPQHQRSGPASGIRVTIGDRESEGQRRVDAHQDGDYGDYEFEDGDRLRGSGDRNAEDSIYKDTCASLEREGHQGFMAYLRTFHFFGRNYNEMKALALVLDALDGVRSRGAAAAREIAARRFVGVYYAETMGTWEPARALEREEGLLSRERFSRLARDVQRLGQVRKNASSSSSGGSKSSFGRHGGGSDGRPHASRAPSAASARSQHRGGASSGRGPQQGHGRGR